MNERDSAMHSDSGKPAVMFLPPGPLLQVADVFGYGERKYDAYNWRKGMEWSRLYSSALRHLWAWFRGEDKDPESGHPHLAHAVCNLLMIMDYSEFNLGKDDREFRA